MLGTFLLAEYTRQSRSCYFSMFKHSGIYIISIKCSDRNFVRKICPKRTHSIKLKLWDKSFFQHNNDKYDRDSNMAGAHTQHSKASRTSSSTNLAMPKCEKTFLYQRMFEKYPTSEPNKGLDI